MRATLLGWLQPRDYGAAARVISMLAMVAAGVTIVFAAVAPDNHSFAEIGITIVVGVAVALAGWRVHYPHEIHPYYWAIAPFLATCLIALLDVVTSDASVSGQIFFFFPALYGSSQLRRPGAMIVTGTGVLGEVIVVGWLAPIREALVEIGYVSAAMITTAGLLIVAGEHQEALVAQLRQQAAIDPLTGLVTRRVLNQAAHSALAGAASSHGTALMLVDIDGFKLINDRYGHPAGDAVLVQLAGLLVRGCRPDDVVSRLGGDEIALLLLGCSEPAMIKRAEGLLQQIRTKRFEINDQQSIAITVSAGLAHAPTEADDLQALYFAADEALYRAKAAGRDQVVGRLSRTSAVPPADGTRVPILRRNLSRHQDSPPSH